jgi:hypothetical protein
MSLELAAKHLETQGRGGDTQLVHMSPNELRALNKLSIDHIGKPLSINPTTGLHEAGFLSSILPTVVGIAGAAMGLPTWAVIGGAGLLATAMTGDIGQGIMAGLGAWGGTQLGADIAGAAGAVQEGANVATLSSDLAANAALDPSKYVGVATNGMPASMGAGASSVIDTTGGLANIGSAGTKFAQGVNAAPLSSWDQFSKGWSNVTKDPVGFLKQPGVGMHVAGAALPPLLDSMQPEYAQPPAYAQKKNPFNLKSITSDFSGTFPTQPNPYYSAQYPNYQTNPYTAKNGGLMDVSHYKSQGKVAYQKQLSSMDTLNRGVDMMSPKSELAPIVSRDPGDAYGGPGIIGDESGYEGLPADQKAYAKLQALMKSTLKSPLSKGLQPASNLGSINLMPAELRQRMLEDQAKQQIVQESAKGGLMSGHLGDYSDGGRLLKGPGDGVSDSIPATIGGKQAARLAEGEFVIPARIVSELGNGSTDAGAKRLYAMMDRIKAKRRKAKDIAADTKSYHYLPA